MSPEADLFRHLKLTQFNTIPHSRLPLQLGRITFFKLITALHLYENLCFTNVGAFDFVKKNVLRRV